MPESTRQPLRGRRGRERKIAERVAADFAQRHARQPGDDAVDFDVDAVDAEVEDARRAAVRAVPRARPSEEPRRSGHRLPDLSALPPLLAGTGSFATIRERLGSPGDVGRVGRHAGVVAVPHGAKSYLAAALALDERIVWIGRDAEIGDRVAEELQAWLGDPSKVAVLDPRTALAYERSELVADETAARVAALAAWRQGRARVLVASVQALLQHTIAPGDLPDDAREIRVGGRLHQDALLRDLFHLGYSPVTEVAGRGEFARRGGIVDVFPPSMDLPIRIEFFGDEIDSLRAFDPTDQRTTGKVEHAVLLPASEFLLPTTGVAAIRERLGRGCIAPVGATGRRPGPVRGHDRRPAAPQRRDRHAGWVPGVRRRRCGGGLAGTPGRRCGRGLGRPPRPGDRARPHRSGHRPDPGRARRHRRGGGLPVAPGRRAARPSSSRPASCPKDWPSTYLPPRDWKARLVASRTLELTWESEPPADVAMASSARSSGDLFGWREPTLPLGRTGRLADAVETWREDGARIVLASDQAPRLAEILEEAGHSVAVVDRIEAPPPPGAIALVGRSLNGGFVGGPDGVTFVTDRELFGTVRVRRPKALRRVVPRDLLERLSPGDLVVHIDHGVARYQQMLRRGGAGEERDYLELAFAGNDRIFVPVEQIGRVTRYAGGERPALSKLGGTEWLRAKQKVRKAVAELADDLLALYAAREDADGHAFMPDTPWQGEMEASFPYEETMDQLRATAEVKADMERSVPMDRLVVGDVGYGKTEVALRGAFKATQDGRQVAVLVPTTVLAAQHHTTFGQRFAAFPIEVRLLSRFVPPKEQAATLAGLADGSVDIVIGTHRLLSKDVRFKDLGLVVVDEEQRFGVAAKERLKQLRREVDVLTLSATPIPRTLNLAMAGIRDLSVIETPPEDRLPIQTRVAEASAGLVRDAMLRELDRGGQVFYVHNRVETIEAQAEQLRRLLPDARFVVGHGQMPEGALEKVMIAFAAGEADVLVSTTIIESGLDIPNANTIIIDRADTLGLAQLYQLRGRVGRSSRRAYAYLLYRRRERLSDEARKRLQAIFNASELGAGFQIALSDLEIRGAGNILGAEQSGHMAAVGFDLYSRMLAEAVEAQKASREGRAPIVVAPQAVVDLPVDAHLPDDYVPDEAQKLELYRRLARARTAGDIAAFRQEVTDRFGPMPASVERLVEVAELRLAAEVAGVSSISREEGRLVVRFGEGLTREAAMRLLGDGGLPGVRPTDVTFASNQVRIRVPTGPDRAWQLTRAVVARCVRCPREPDERPF